MNCSDHAWQNENQMNKLRLSLIELSLMLNEIITELGMYFSVFTLPVRLKKAWIFSGFRYV
jgi:hypothetical protein